MRLARKTALRAGLAMKWWGAREPWRGVFARAHVGRNDALAAFVTMALSDADVALDP